MAKWALKDRAITGLKFMDKYGIEYKFDEEEDAIIEEKPIDMAPYPDMPAEAPEIMTQYENLIDGENVIEDKPVSSNEEQAMMAAENSGLEFGTVGKSPAAGELIELLDDDKNDMLDNNIWHDEQIRVKEEPQQAKITDENEDDEDEDHTNKTAEEQPRRSGKEQAPPKRLKDYEVYVTVKEEDKFMLTTCTDNEVTSSDENDHRALEAVAHYIMVRYKEKEKLKKRKKKYRPKIGQYGLDAGLCHFGDRAEMAVTKELHQFNTYDVFGPIAADSLSDEEKKKALSSLMFLKEKQNGTVKAQSYANGSVQRSHVVKEEVVSPTVALESVFVMSTIDARENREVVTIDIPGAFLHAKNKDYIVMQMNGTLAELMAKTDPKLYRKYLVDKKGKKVLHLCLQKALYGMMKSALLVYQKLVSELRSMGFIINPYDPCVANKIVNRKQLTLQWHVDDLMISHVNIMAINKFL